MGGNALTEGLTRRHNASEYFDKIGQVINHMQYANGILRSQLIESYRSKASFGDADILYSTYDNKPFSTDAVRKIFPESKEISRNSSVISFEYDYFILPVTIFHKDLSNLGSRL
jgi:hypothetical protein